MNRIVLAYSGGFATSTAIPWLAQKYGAEVVTVTLDLGEERELAAVRERALGLGAVRAHVIDAREELVRDFILPSLQAGIFDEPHLALAAAITRPLIARRLVGIARMEGAVAVAHGGRPGTPLETALHLEIASLANGLDVIAPVRVWGSSDVGVLDFARAHDVPVPPPPAVWTDGNVWGRVLRADAAASLDDACRLTRAADEGPGTAAVVDIEFEGGRPVRTNGVEMSLLEMIESLETIAGAHGVGRAASGADGLIEAPAAMVLQIAQRELEVAVLGPDLADLKRRLALVHAELVTHGRWFSDVRESIDGFVATLQPRMTGRVRLHLLKGHCSVPSREAPHDVASAAPKAVA